MLYIKKTQPSHDLLNWISEKKREGTLHPQYSTLQTQNASVPSYIAYTSLREQLFEEQNGLCCYCMKKITAGNSNIEHFLPQSIFPENEVDYYNLYLACRHSHGFAKGKQHCDIAKGNALISKYIGHNHVVDNKKCQDFFQYTHDGYILPNKTGFVTLQKFYQDYSSLTLQEKELLGTIEILNLNCESLVNERSKFINTEILKINQADVVRLEKMIHFYESNPIAFAGVALYFLKQRLKQLV